MTTSPDPKKVDRRFAHAYLSELLAGLGVAQDDSTATGVLDAAYDVQRKRMQGVGEVVEVTWPVSPDPGYVQALRRLRDEQQA